MITSETWFDLICKSYRAPAMRYEGKSLPGFPSDELQTWTTGQAGLPTLKEAWIFYEDCLEQYVRLKGSRLSSQHSLLDFGVGWGRICRFFLRDIPPQNIFGIDVSREFIEICQRSFRSNNFINTKPFPPTPIPNNRFDIIVGYSVFSHLSMQACSEWMTEFHRILTPGGVLILTTRGRSFLDICESFKAIECSGYQNALSRIFEDFDSARMKYDRGEFLHSNIEGVTGGGEMNSSFYGETFIPKNYAETAYSDHFRLENFIFDPLRQTQPIMVFSKVE